jgi:hypothetical protein
MVHVDFKFSSPVMTFQLDGILASTKLWSLYRVTTGGHKCGKSLRIMLQHMIYVPVPRFIVIVRMDYYAHSQFRRNSSLQYLYISSQIFQIPRFLIKSLWWLTE